MSYDRKMLHCSNGNCELKDVCARHNAWKEVKGTEAEEQVLVSRRKSGGIRVWECADFLYDETLDEE